MLFLAWLSPWTLSLAVTLLPELTGARAQNLSEGQVGGDPATAEGENGKGNKEKCVLVHGANGSDKGKKKTSRTCDVWLSPVTIWSTLVYREWLTAVYPDSVGNRTTSRVVRVSFIPAIAQVASV